MFKKYVGRGFNVASNTLQFAYTQLTQTEDEQPVVPVRGTQQPLARDNGVHYGSFDINSQTDSTANTIKADNHKSIDTQQQLDSGPSAMPGETNDVEYTYRPQIAINESEELVNGRFAGIEAVPC